ncbi:MAG: ferredoxin [Bacilli bacterium]
MEKLIVNQDTCISCGACIQIDEEHFDFSENGTSVAISQENLESEAVNMAKDACPVGAISIIEVEDNETSCNCGDNCHCADNSIDGKCHCHNDEESHCSSC